jgi:hypothetical protein
VEDGVYTVTEERELQKLTDELLKLLEGKKKDRLDVEDDENQSEKIVLCAELNPGVTHCLNTTFIGGVFEWIRSSGPKQPGKRQCNNGKKKCNDGENTDETILLYEHRDFSFEMTRHTKMTALKNWVTFQCVKVFGVVTAQISTYFLSQICQKWKR